MASPAVAAPSPRGYFAQTRSWTYSAALALPVLAIYELAVLGVDAGTHSGVRNGADALLRSVAALLGGGFWLVPVVTAAVLLFLAFRERRSGVALRRGWLLGATVEALAYALFFGGVVGRLTALVLPRAMLGTGLDGMPVWAQVVLSLGAGFYEEVLFRGLVLGGLRSALGLWMQPRARDALAVFASAAIFSAYHHLLGDPFSVSVFVFRLIAGLLLSGLLVLRGFGITVLTHAFYDVLFSLGLAL
jgi:membrane protease YdiL (CAAX protease family)